MTYPSLPTKALPDDYERDDNDNETEDKIAPRIIHPHPLIPLAMQMIVPRGINTNPYLPKKLLRTTMNDTMKKTTKRTKLK